MSLEKTLCIIKPDALEQRKQGAIVQRLLDEGFKILAMQQVHLSRRAAEGFYAVHRERPFFDELCTFMTRGRSPPSNFDQSARIFSATAGSPLRASPVAAVANARLSNLRSFISILSVDATRLKLDGRVFLMSRRGLQELLGFEVTEIST